jgi:adenine-specific DNA-methyltransferase
MKITRTELVWPGKYDDKGDRVEPPRGSLPFQVIETVNVSRASREAAGRPEQRTLFDYWDPKEGSTFEEGWRNKLIWGDNLLVMNSLMERFEGKIDLIYIDPPFGTGSDFEYSVEIGDGDAAMLKEPSLIEEKAYRDTWSAGYETYMPMLYDRLVLLRELLAPSGSIFVHLDAHTGPYVKVVLDEIFGLENFRNEIAWYYYNKMHDSRKRLLPKAFDQILYYVKSKDAAFAYNALEEQREVPVKQLKRVKVAGVMKNARDDLGRVIYQEKTTRTVDNVWRIRCLQPANKEEWVNFETQKPVDLLQRIVELASRPRDIVLDAFAGSGSSLVAAELLGRRWIGIDIGRYPIHLTRKRLLDVKECRPFEVLNLGRYERQYWQGVMFGDGKNITQQAVYQYLAFVLKLYEAEPVAGMEHLHGRRGGAMVHIGAVDAPITIDEITRCLDECAALKQKELHVLGWEWEMGLAGPNNDVKTGGLMHQAAKAKGIKLLLLQIPREVMEQQAAQKGDVQFFELAYLDVAITKSKKLTAVIGLKAFVIPNTDLIPEDVRAKVTRWSDYIDYWSVDWDFQNDTFIQGFVTYRTRKNRKLLLVSEPHTYQKPGKYRVVVKVIDIFGNDTSQGYTVEV